MMRKRKPVVVEVPLYIPELGKPLTHGCLVNLHNRSRSTVLTRCWHDQQTAFQTYQEVVQQVD